MVYPSLFVRIRVYIIIATLNRNYSVRTLFFFELVSSMLLYQEETFCDFNHILFNCPSALSDKPRLFFFSFILSPLGYHFPRSYFLLNTRSPIAIYLINYLIHNPGFLIRRTVNITHIIHSFVFFF